MTEIVRLSDTAVPAPETAPTALLLTPAANSAGGFLVKPGGVSGRVESYTLIYDIYLSSADVGRWNGLFQTDLTNQSDGDLFIRRDSATSDRFGVGISGDYPGNVAMDEWRRIVFSIDSDGTSVAIRRFVDGAFVGEIVKEVERYAFNAEDGFLIMADENGELLPSYLSAFAIIPRALADVEIEALGGVNGGGAASGIGGALEFGFDNADLAATLGEGTMIPRDPAQAGQFLNAGEGAAPEPGREKNLLRFEAAAPHEGLAAKPALADDATRFTLVYDILIDPGSEGFGGLFQTNIANDDDGDLFLQKLGDAYGVGISGQYDGAATAGEWARLVFTVEDLGGGSSRLIKYIDGAKVGEQTVPTGRFTVDAQTGFLILADDDGETWGGYLSGFAFAPRVLSDGDVAALGGAKIAPLPQSLLGADALIHDFAAGGVAGAIPARSGAPLIDLSYDPASELNPDLALAYGADGPDGGYLIEAAFGAPVASFTMFFDLAIDAGDQGVFGALAQFDAANADDGEFFLRANDAGGGYGIGINGDYAGDIRPGEWARIGVSVEALGDGTSRLAKFVDGAMVGEQIVSTARFTINPESGFLLLTDNDGETFSGKLASFSVLDRALSDAEIAEKGAAAVGGALRAAAPGETLIAFDFIAEAKIVNGAADATFGDGRILDRAFEPVAVAQEVLHRLLKVGDVAEIDLAEVFSGDNLSFALSGGGEALDATLDGSVLSVSATALGFADFTVTATDDLGNSAEDSFRLRVAGDNAYSFAVLPDTQNYTNDGMKHIYQGMIDWLAANRESMKLQVAAHVGDVTGSNRPGQWAIVSDIYQTLDAAGLPYTLLPGNHDQSSGGTAADHSSLLDDYFDAARYFAHGQQGGAYDGEPDSLKNNYKIFTAPDGTKWIVLSIEFGPREDVLLWANEVLTAHADHRAMVLTHHYTNMADIAGPDSGPLYAEGTGKNYRMQNDPESVHDGRDIWDKLISKHGNVSFVFSGHVFGDGAETIVRYGEQGNAVAQMFVNYQNGVARIMQTAGVEGLDGNGGNGAMRIVVVDPDNDAVHTETYYDDLDVFMTGSRGAPEPSRDGVAAPEETETEITPIAFGSTNELGLPPIPGDDGGAPAMLIPQFNPLNGVLVQPDFSPAEGGALFNHYTLVWDMFIPENIGLVSILQTELRNVTDGDLWIQGDGAGGGLIGAAGQDDGPFMLGVWSRVVVVFDRLEGDGVRYRADKYVDGELMGSQIFEGERRTVKDGGFILFGDDGNETPSNWGLSSFAFVEKALSAEEAAALGGVDADGPFAAFPEGVNGLQFAAGDDQFAITLGAGVVTQELPVDTELELTGAYREHQETLEGFGAGAPPEALFRADAGADAVVDLDLDLASAARVTLDGSGSTDLAAQVTTAEWFDPDGVKVADGLAAEIDAEVGANRYRLKLADAEGRISEDSVMIVGADDDTLLFDNFNDGTLDGWRVISGAWDAAGAARAPSGRAEAHLQMNRAAEGLILIDREDAAGWDRYTVSAEIENENSGRCGLVIGANAAGDMYRLEFSVGAHEFALVKIVDGVREVLAVQADGPAFDRVFTAELSLDAGRLAAAVDGRGLFGGPVTDIGAPLQGTAGFFHQGAFRANIDNVHVRKGALIADAGPDLRILDHDGDGVAIFSPGARAGDAAWSLDGEAQEGDEIEIALGRHALRLDQSWNGESAHDHASVELVAKRDILLTEDFSEGSDRWLFVDEGERGDPAVWSVQDGELVQTSDRYSRQLRGEGDTASSTFWALDWSPLGDGYHVLRKGAYALLDDPASAGWTDYSVAFDFASPSGGAVGLLFRYQDPDNHYKLELDRAGGSSQLVSVIDGIEQLLWQAEPDYDTGGVNRLRVDVSGGTISASLDGFELFAPVNAGVGDLAAGGVALYNWGAPGTSYDNLEIISLEERREVSGGGGSDRLAGGDENDLILAEGGDDRIGTGAGEDVIVFTAAGNGDRERVEIGDFDVAADRLDLMGAAVSRHIEKDGDVWLLLEGDGDVLVLRGAGVFDDINFV